MLVPILTPNIFQMAVDRGCNVEDLVIEEVRTATDEVRALIGELDQVLSEGYPAEQRHGLSVDAIFQPNILFFLARLGTIAVGCGGVAFFSDFREGDACMCDRARAVAAWRRPRPRALRRQHAGPG